MNCVLFAEMDQVFSLKIIDIKKILENGKKYWKSQGILSVQKSGNPVYNESVTFDDLLEQNKTILVHVQSGIQIRSDIK